MPEATELRIAVPGAGDVSGLLMAPIGARACLVLAHGAGAGMRHAFMADLATSLGARGIATLRYQFPYAERGASRTDPPPVCHATVRAACAAARERCPGLPLFASGKSFGGRMTSQAQGLEPLAEVRGIAFFGFPLHPAGKPGIERAKHLAGVRIPMLFMQGTRDELAEWSLVEPLVQKLGPHATLHVVHGADHAFHRRVRDGGGKATDVTAELADAFVTWLGAIETPQR